MKKKILNYFKKEKMKKKKEKVETTQANDLGLMVGTPEQSLWKNVEEQTTQLIKKLKDDLEINTAIQKLAELKVKNLN